jgi:hypothetical protein
LVSSLSNKGFGVLVTPSEFAPAAHLFVDDVIAGEIQLLVNVSINLGNFA